MTAMKNLLLFVLIIAVPASAQYSYTVHRESNARRAGETNEVRIDVSTGGRVVHTVRRTLPFDVPYPLVTLETGSGVLVLRYVFDGFVEVYGPEGRLRWTHTFFKDEEPNYERTINCRFFGNDVLFLVSDSNRERAVVHRYDANGARQWTAELPFPTAYELAVSEDEGVIVAGSYEALEDEVRSAATFLTADGNTVWSAPILFRHAVFPKETGTAVLASERELLVADLRERRVAARGGRATDGIITDIAVRNGNVLAAEAEVVTEGKGFSYRRAALVVRDMNLEQVRTLHGDGGSVTAPRIVLGVGTARLEAPGIALTIPFE